MTRLINIAFFCGVLALAQRPFTQRQFSWDALSLPLPNQKAIRIDLVGADCHSIIGVRVDRAAQSTVSIADVIHEPMSSRIPINRLHRISKPANDRISISGDTLRVVCSVEAGASERVFISADQQIKVAIRKNDVLLVSVAVEQGVLIRDGLAESTTPEGMHQLILEGVSPLLSSANLTGTTRNLTEVRMHLQTFTIPKSSAPVGTTGLIQLTIDPTGHVSGAVAPNLNEGALETIRSWVFTPFVTGGQPSTAHSLIPFLVTQDGSLACGIDPNARVH